MTDLTELDRRIAQVSDSMNPEVAHFIRGVAERIMQEEMAKAQLRAQERFNALVDGLEVEVAKADPWGMLHVVRIKLDGTFFEFKLEDLKPANVESGPVGYRKFS